MNILLTSIGRRVQLIEHLQKTFTVIGADASENNAGRHFTDDFYVIPQCSASDYVEVLLKICVAHDVKMVIPLYEGEFMSLCRNRALFEQQGIQILLSDTEVIELCNHKLKTQEFFEKEHIPAPKLTDTAPAVVKPVCGMGSQGVYRVESNESLAAAKVLLQQDYIIQEQIKGVEYTVDVLCDFEGNVVSAVPRERVEVRSGEVSKSRTVRNEWIIRETCRLISKLNQYGTVRGPMTVQCFLKDDVREEDRDRIVFLEINPRFGGGVPLTFEAGVDYGAYLMKFLNGYIHQGGCVDFQEVSMVRFDRAVYERI